MFITDKGMKNSSAKYFPRDTVVVAMYGATAAQVGILRFECTSNQAVCGLLPNKAFSPDFVYYFFTHNKDSLAAKAQGGAQPNISQEKIKQVVIPVPPLAEQQEIVGYLDKAFAKIDALKKNAEQQLSDAKALFSAALEESMTPKEGWLHVKFGDIATYHKETFQGPGLPYIGMENIEGNTGQLLSHSYSDTVLSNSFRFKSGEVLYGRLRPYLKKVCVATFDGCCSTEIFPISSNRVLSPYLKYWFLTDTITNKINETCSGCRMPRGNMNEVKKFNFSYPKTLPEQQAIVAHLDTLSSKVNQLQDNYNKILRECDALKQALLREIFEQ